MDYKSSLIISHVWLTISKTMKKKKIILKQIGVWPDAYQKSDSKNIV